MSLLTKIREKYQVNSPVAHDSASDGLVRVAHVEQKPPVKVEQKFTGLAEKLERQLIATAQGDFETVPRDTVLKLLHRNMDELFIFNTALGQGENYVQAMRQVLSRTRKRAEKKRVVLEEFKLYIVTIQSKDDVDCVTLVRTKGIPEHLVSVYDELTAAFSKQNINA
jgi:hypothetical protein